VGSRPDGWLSAADPGAGPQVAPADDASRRGCDLCRPSGQARHGPN